MDQFPKLTDQDRNTFTRQIGVRAIKLPLQKLHQFLKTHMLDTYPNSKPRPFSKEYV
jgi:hypothetical protein